MTAAPGHAPAYHVVQVRPPGYIHAEALTELVLATYHGLRRLGVPTRLDAAPGPAGRQIIFGAHLLDAGAIANLPHDAIIYNTEQMTGESPWLGSVYLRLLHERTVWDYSLRNVSRLQALGIRDVHYVPVGFVPELVRIPPAGEDIDVLFYGSMNDRRRHVLEELMRRGLKVVHLFGTYGRERDRAIGHAKVQLNVHFYASKVFEIVRVSYLLSNYRAVVAECGPDTELEPELRAAVRAVPYEELADACEALVRDAPARQALAERGFRIFSRRRAQAILGGVLGIPVPEPDSTTPRSLNVGCGADLRHDHLNVDIDPGCEPDAVLDLADPALVGAAFDTRRFGRIVLEPDSFERVLANRVLEYIPDLAAAMTNALRLLSPGGLMLITVPHPGSAAAATDRPVMHTFTPDSWRPYTDDHQRLGWTEARFDLVSVTFQPTALGTTLASGGTPLNRILETPGAVATMQVGLRKRYLWTEDRIR